MKLRSFARVVLALNFLIAAAWSQETRAVINGTVTDPQGAVVPAAIVEVKNLETNVVSKTVSNDHGLYTIPPVNPGMYSVTVSANGFKTVIRRNVELRVGDRVAVDFKLDLGGTTAGHSQSAVDRRGFQPREQCGLSNPGWAADGQRHGQIQSGHSQAIR